MRLDTAILFLLSLVFVYGDQEITKVVAKRDGVSSLNKRQSTCQAGYFACSAAEGGGCCPADTTCTTTICLGGETTCTSSGEEVCGMNCCVSPLVCDESTSQCVQGSSTSTPNNTPSTDTCLTTTGACSWLLPLGDCNSDDETCICDVFVAATSSQIQACVSCEQSLNATLASEISTIAGGCGSTNSQTGSTETPITTSVTTNSVTTNSVTSKSVSPVVFITSPTTTSTFGVSTPTSSTSSTGSVKSSAVGKGFDGSAACFLVLLGMAAGAVAYL